jgi:hypothetical protein
MIIRRTLVTASLLLCIAMGSASIAAAQGERVPDAGVVNGVPQGIFVGRSLLTGRSVCLLFLSGSRITRAIPEGGLENFDWARHRAAHAADSGKWEMRGGQLVVAWGDGGVHQGPITVNPSGIEFYGKRYSKPVPANVAAIAGRWESARGTAIGGGAGINTVNALVIQADGRYQWASTTGGVVAGMAVAGDRAMSGEVTIKGLTIIFTSDNGKTTSHTFLPAAGVPVSAFSVDADMFTRVGPVPAAAPAASAPAAQGSNYQGVSFTTPSGWTSGVQDGRLSFVPTDATPDTAVVVVLYGAEPLSGRSLDDWFRAKMAADLNPRLKALQESPARRAKSGVLQTLSAGRTVQDASGGVRLQIYYGISDGQQAGLAMVVTASEAAMSKHIAGVQALFQSLGFTTATRAGASPPPAGSAIATGRKKEITPADVAGAWGHSSASYTEYVNSSGNRTGSSTIAWGDGYELLPDGTYAYVFTGMVDSRYVKEQDSGTWDFERGNLVIRSKTGRRPKEYQILAYEVAPDGVVFMTVLDVYYPRTKENIEMYAEKWVKKAQRPALSTRRLHQPCDDAHGGNGKQLSS